MRRRSSQLFVVLLYLVSISTNRAPTPKDGNSGVPVVVVNPIVLEELDLQKHNGLDGLLKHASEQEKQETMGDDELLLSEPYWLKDVVDDKCLGPFGFSDCGDATLWMVRRKQSPSQQRSSSVEWGYALEWMDADGVTIHNHNNHTVMNGHSTCLIKRRKRRQKHLLDVAHCLGTRETQVWTWKLDGNGILQRITAPMTKTKQLNHPSQQHHHHHQHQQQQRNSDSRKRQCLWRVNETSAMLSSCHQDDDAASYMVQLAMVRYHTQTTKSKYSVAVQEEAVEDDSNVADHRYHIPTTTDLAHSQALATGSRKRGATGTTAKTDIRKRRAHPFLTLHDTNAILYYGSNDNKRKRKRKSGEKAVTATGGGSGSGGGSDASYKLGRMQTHPYLATAKNEVWTDPQTGLAYRTDLCHYLGHDRKKSGRHTLVGVGQYTKTVLKVKVYGVALYVSKRDVLADPIFEKFASLTADQLRQRPDFYAHLRTMPLPQDAAASIGGMVDRTLLLKLNMQLSTDVMRSSLAVDWKLLSQEMKDLLINSSLKPRPADEDMLRVITDRANNPNRCSCGQVAPPEYNADNSCCARGTELVFTWRKNSNLEARLNGRVMDIFPRPDVAEGIFYEYLRSDDPMTPDFIRHVVDGFPFLLAPLSQVKGVSALPPPPVQPTKSNNNNNIIKAMGDKLSSHASDVAGWVQDNTGLVLSNVANVAKAVGYDMDHKRNEIWHQVSTLPENTARFLSQRGGTPKDKNNAMDGSGVNKKRSIHRNRKRGKVFRSTFTKWFGGTDDGLLLGEIEPMIGGRREPRLISALLVHLYLLLLLIVSLPASHQTRYHQKTNPQEKKQCASDTESEASTESFDDRGTDDEIKQEEHQEQEGKQEQERKANNEHTRIPKALSYYL